MSVNKLKELIEDIQLKMDKEDLKIIDNSIEQAKLVRSNDINYWDISKDTKIEFFDPTLSYELTGYRPIDKTHGLDFNPEWFIETRNTFLRTGHYCPYLPDSKRYREFWKEQYKRCKEGFTCNGYTITGDNYFFLNFYQLPLMDTNNGAGNGTKRGFPAFFASHYTFFHYLNMCRITKRNCCMMKARSMGFSEIMASVLVRMYEVIRESKSMLTAADDRYINTTFKKVTDAINWLNVNTDLGMFKPELISQALHRKSGYKEKINGQFQDKGFASELIAINGSDPSNIRGDRVDLLLYEEAGSFPNLAKAVIQGQELCEVAGNIRGILCYGGTGGDKGSALEGLKDIYYNPKAFKVLPFRHNMTQDGSVIDSGFFLPYYKLYLGAEDYMDSRGVCDEDRYKEYLLEVRNNLLSVPKRYTEKCAEQCWNAEEAFLLLGQNKFNKTNIANLLAVIRLHKIGPRPEAGILSYTFKSDLHTADNISGFKWQPKPNSKLLILEHPRWSDNFKPIVNEQGEVVTPRLNIMNNLYVAGIDGIDIGANQTSKETRDPSDFCIMIKRRAYGLNDPQIVAIYKDRPNNIREAYKIAMCLIRYYNCKVNIEATRVGFLTWARENKGLQYFMKRPRATMGDVKNGKANTYGTPATKTIINQQTDLIADFVEDYCDNIWFEEVLLQLLEYNDETKTKFDIVATMGMLELADQELSGRVPLKTAPVTEDWQDFGYWIDDKGIRHYGVIPKKKTITQFNIEQPDDPYRIETSDPRLYESLVQGGIHWRYQN